MVTCNFMGGLGNNLFQLATLINLAEKGKYEFCIPTIRRGWPDPINFRDLFEYDFPYNDSAIAFNYQAPDMFGPEEARKFEYSPIPETDELRLIGYFQSEKYFKDIEDILKKKYFRFKKENETYILEKYGDILKNQTVALHVRVGFDKPGLQPYHPNVTKEFYLEALEKIDHDIIVILSDDIAWCKNNLSDIGNVVFIEGETANIDLTLMSKCSHNIICNSSFSWWGAWLNNNPEKIVVAPKTQWFGPMLRHLNIQDLIPENWVAL
jgi:hypothetical protein